MSSCSQEEGPAGGADLNTGRRIVFRTSLPGVTSRAQQVADIDSCHITAFDPADESRVDASGNLSSYFDNVKIKREPDNTFTSGDCVWPKSDGPVHFMAFYPPIEHMRGACTVPDNQDFNIDNRSTKTAAETSLHYRINSFHLASDLSKQVDFITAYSVGHYAEDYLTGINLDFKHQLSQVELSAWCDSKVWNIEVAGVRFGSAVAKADFVFSPTGGSAPAEIGYWENPVHEPVQYIFTKGDRVVNLSEASTPEKSLSIMGASSEANMIPGTHTGWNVTADSTNVAEGLYISVLMNVTYLIDESHPQVYPYTHEGENMEVVYLEVDGQGEIAGRVYKSGPAYYSDPQFTELHTPAAGNTVRAFGWAAIPVGSLKWEPGYIYRYRLDFTDGVGLHDPLDPHPGRSILSDRVRFTYTVDEWKPASNTNTTVPRK